jgi:hypothetical protein
MVVPDIVVAVIVVAVNVVEDRLADKLVIAASAADRPSSNEVYSVVPFAP